MVAYTLHQRVGVVSDVGWIAISFIILQLPFCFSRSPADRGVNESRTWRPGTWWSPRWNGYDGLYWVACATSFDLLTLAVTRYCFTLRLLWRINHACVAPSHLHCPYYCNTIARLLRNIRRPTDSPFVCHTLNNIGDGKIVIYLPADRGVNESRTWRPGKRLSPRWIGWRHTYVYIYVYIYIYIYTHTYIYIYIVSLSGRSKCEWIQDLKAGYMIVSEVGRMAITCLGVVFEEARMATCSIRFVCASLFKGALQLIMNRYE